jgi:hypothetical protein
MGVSRAEVIRAIDTLPRGAWVAQGNVVQIGKESRIVVEGVDAQHVARSIALLPDVLHALQAIMGVQFRTGILEQEIERLSAWVAEYGPINDGSEDNSK